MKSKHMILVTLLSVSFGTQAAPTAPRDPEYVRYTLAGRDLRQRGTAIRDSRAGYFLSYKGGMRGAYNDLALVPVNWPKDGSDIQGDPWMFAPERSGQGTLRHLRTGTGVNIGDSASTIQRKLKAPPQDILIVGPMHNWTYYAVVTVGQGAKRRRMNYEANYLLYRGKLLAIHYNLTNLENG